MMLMLPACVRTVNPDGTTTLSADPCAVDAITEGGDAAVGIMTVLTPFFPWLAPIAAATAGIVGTIKIKKPQLVKAQTRQKMFHTVASSAVLAIDNLAKTNPDLTAKLLAEMEVIKTKIVSPEDRAAIENVIRALRGKPPKEEATEA
jgi:hypothetical protein